MAEQETKFAWRSFKDGKWSKGTDVSDFIRLNYTPYEGDSSFLAPATDRTKKVWGKVLELMDEERRNNGLLSADVSTPSAVDSHAAGYIDRDNEIIVGLQTDAPLRRAIMPYGGYRMVRSSCEAYGLKEDEKVKEIFTKYRKTHNDGVYDAYTPEILAARKSAIITGLPDAYGRGRIIGDYRRLALYGADYLIADKKAQKADSDNADMTEEVIRQREELSEQIKALEAVKRMTLSYGIDVSQPANNFREAVQWTYFAYLAAIKDQNGAAMSLGRVSTFLDIYAQRDIEAGDITESDAQEVMDDFIIKLRMVRFLRTPEYNDLFSGDPVWVTESVGGMCSDGRTYVTKNSFRLLHTLSNLGPAPEPNITVLWSEKLPRGFKEFCAKTSVVSSSIQYENDDLMRPLFGDDYGIACCVSPLVIGKEMQFFGARANLAKALLYAINGGVDERTGALIAKGFEPIRDEVLDYDRVMEKFDKMMDWLSRTYVNALNIIHYMHDKYYYEKAQLAFMDRDVVRKLGCGIAGFSVVTDSLSAIKYAKVKPQVAHIPQRDTHAVDSHDYLQRSLRQENGQHSRRQNGGRAVCAWGESASRARHERRVGVAVLGREAAVQRRKGRDFQHVHDTSRFARQVGRRKNLEFVRLDRRVYVEEGAASECERPEKGSFGGRDGSPREVSAVDD